MGIFRTKGASKTIPPTPVTFQMRKPGPENSVICPFQTLTVMIEARLQAKCSQFQPWPTFNSTLRTLPSGAGRYVWPTQPITKALTFKGLNIWMMPWEYAFKDGSLKRGGSKTGGKRGLYPLGCFQLPATENWTQSGLSNKGGFVESASVWRPSGEACSWQLN